MIHFSKRQRPQPTHHLEHDPGTGLQSSKPQSNQFAGIGATLGVNYRGQQFTGGKVIGPPMSSKSLRAQPREDNENFVTNRGAAGNFTFRDQTPMLTGEGEVNSGVSFQISQTRLFDWITPKRNKPKVTPPPEKTGTPKSQMVLLPGATQ